MNNTFALKIGSDYGNLMFGYSHAGISAPLDVSLAGTTHTLSNIFLMILGTV